MNKKNKIYLFIAFLLSAAVIIKEVRKVSFQVLVQEFNQINLIFLGAALLCMLIHWGIEAEIIKLFLKRTNPSFSFVKSYRIPLIEHLFNAITPFSTGGQPAQIVALSKSGVDSGVAASVSLMKFVVYQIWIVINFILCILFGFKWLSTNLREMTFLVILSFIIHFVIVLALLMVMYWYKFTNKLVSLFFNWLIRIKKGPATEALRRRTVEKMANFYEESRYLKSRPSLMIKASLLTVFQLVAYYIVPYFILLAVGVNDVSPIQVVVFHAFIIMVISLFPIPGGTGGAEYSFTVLFGSYIAANSKLVLAILLWRIVTYYIGILLGLGSLLISPKNY
ncbi:lysylphosphatidylglycerol synthase transmembrane domain-containing protein [Vagococcus vulneris]|uniref:Phosphatidylglycerol lysyltransferase n=1 Tax=Vagococcus vulneris TaxID=1977869 RepID=A0A429ZT75_9ENTE|nr:lysylphosphatidylglycerol synthase transmembrane domain-containing protein [Vagococcus vulneris]RST96927.1 hypothetical protein CBF37_10565 [Vagococcus vulneris]